MIPPPVESFHPRAALIHLPLWQLQENESKCLSASTEASREKPHWDTHEEIFHPGWKTDANDLYSLYADKYDSHINK